MLFGKSVVFLLSAVAFSPAAAKLGEVRRFARDNVVFAMIRTKCCDLDNSLVNCRVAPISVTLKSARSTRLSTVKESIFLI